MDELRVALKNGKIVNFPPSALNEDSYNFLAENAVHPDVAFTAKNGRTVKMSLTDGWDPSMPTNLQSMFADGWTKEAINANNKYISKENMKRAADFISNQSLVKSFESAIVPHEKPFFEKVMDYVDKPIEDLTNIALDITGSHGYVSGKRSDNRPVIFNAETAKVAGRFASGYTQKFIEFAKNVGKGASAYDSYDPFETPAQRGGSEKRSEKRDKEIFDGAVAAVKKLGEQYFGKEDIATSGGKLYLDIQAMNGMHKIFGMGPAGPIAWVKKQLGRPLTNVETRLVEAAVKSASGAVTGAGYGTVAGGGDSKRIKEDAMLFAGFEAVGPMWRLGKAGKDLIVDAYWAKKEPGVAEFIKAAREAFPGITETEMRAGINSLRAKARKEGRSLQEILNAERIKFEKMRETPAPPKEPAGLLPTFASEPEKPVRFVASEDGTLEDLKNPMYGPPIPPNFIRTPDTSGAKLKLKWENGRLVRDYPSTEVPSPSTKPAGLNPPSRFVFGEEGVVDVAPEFGPQREGRLPSQEEMSAYEQDAWDWYRAENPGSASNLNILFSDSGKAKVRFTDKGRAVIGNMSDATIKDFIHETGHIWRRSMTEAELAEVEKTYGVVNGNWTREQEERFAEDFVNYFNFGAHNSKSLKKAFDIVIVGVGKYDENGLLKYPPRNVGEIINKPIVTLNSPFGGADISFHERGKMIIRAMKSATYKDFMHELGHAWRSSMTEAELAEAEKVYSVINGNWTREQEEKFAEDFREYIQGSRRGGKGLHQAFDSTLYLIGSTYKDMKKTPEFKELTKEMNPELKTFLDDTMKKGTTLNVLLKGGTVKETELHAGGGLQWDKVKQSTVDNQLKPANDRVNEFWNGIIDTIAPQGRNAETYKVSLDIRSKLGEKEYEMAQSREALNRGDDFISRTIKKANGQRPLVSVKNELDKLSDMDLQVFKDNLEAGKKQATPELQRASDKLREVLDRLESRLMSIPDTEKLNFIENYFPHIYNSPKSQLDYTLRNFARNPADGIKSFLRPRKFKNLKEARDAGYNELFRNPVDSVLAKAEEVEKFFFGRTLRATGISEGWIKKVVGKEPPEGWVNGDKIFGKIYAPNEIEISGRGRRNLLKASGNETTTNAFERRQIGSYWIQPDIAQLLINHFNPGYGSSTTYKWLRGWTNTLNQTTLGLSGFHAQMTSVQAMMSAVGLAVQYASKGMGKEALMKLIDSLPVYNTVRNFKIGYGVKWNYLRGTEKSLNEIAKLVKMANGRVGQDAAYTDNMVKKFNEAIKEQDIIGSVRTVIPAVVEILSKPLMEKLVPIQKLGIFADMVTYELKVAAKKGIVLTDADLKKIASKAWDSVDNRMGQVVKDNLFWKRTVNDLAQIIIRSPSWNVGTYREIGGGVKDIFTEGYKASKGGGFEVTHRMSYLAGMIFVTGMLGAIATKLYTGRDPEGKDYIYPPTGEFNANGTERRINPVGYAKDVIAFYHDSKSAASGNFKPFAQYFGSKMSPLLSEMISVMSNETYMGEEIWHPGDTTPNQIKDFGRFMYESNLPFSVTNYMKSSKLGESTAKKAATFIGVTPARRSVTNTDAWNKIDEIRNMKGSRTRTKKDVDRYEEIARLRNMLSRGEKTKVREEFKKGQEKGIFKLTDSVDKTIRPHDKPMTHALKTGHFKFLEIVDVYNVANEIEKKEIWPILKDKWFREILTVSKKSPEFDKMTNAYRKIKAERNRK